MKYSNGKCKRYGDYKGINKPDEQNHQDEPCITRKMTEEEKLKYKIDKKKGRG